MSDPIKFPAETFTHSLTFEGPTFMEWVNALCAEKEEIAEQLRLEEEVAEEEGRLIEASGYPDPASDRSFA